MLLPGPQSGAIEVGGAVVGAAIGSLFGGPENPLTLAGAKLGELVGEGVSLVLNALGVNFLSGRPRNQATIDSGIRMQRYAAAMTPPASQILARLGNQIQTAGQRGLVLSSKPDDAKYFAPWVNQAYGELVAAGYPPPGNCLALAVWAGDYRCLLASLRTGISQTPAGPMDCTSALAEYQTCCGATPCQSGASVKAAAPTAGALALANPFQNVPPALGVPSASIAATKVSTAKVTSALSPAATPKYANCKTPCSMEPCVAHGIDWQCIDNCVSETFAAARACNPAAWAAL